MESPPQTTPALGKIKLLPQKPCCQSLSLEVHLLLESSRPLSLLTLQTNQPSRSLQWKRHQSRNAATLPIISTLVRPLTSLDGFQLALLALVNVAHNAGFAAL